MSSSRPENAPFNLQLSRQDLSDEGAEYRLATSPSSGKIAQAIALLLLLWESKNRPALIRPHEEVLRDDHPDVKIPEAICTDILKLLNSHEQLLDIDLSELEKVLDDSDLVKKHSEAQKALYLDFLQLASVETRGSERTKGFRYPKVYRFTKNIDYFGAISDLNPTEYYKTLGGWLLGKEFSRESAFEAKLIRALFSLTENSVYRVRTSIDEGAKLIIFRNHQVYQRLIAHEECNLADKDSKGLVRLLRASLSQNFFPVSVNFKKGAVVFAGDETELEWLKHYSERVGCYISHGNYYVAIVSDGKTDVPKPVSASVNAFKSSEHRNMIFYGVPGSGKSHKLRTLLSPDAVKFTTVFHPDYTYSDFVGQILPTVEDDQVRYQFNPGPLTQAIRSAVRSRDVQHVLIIEEINRGNAAAIFGDIFQLLDRTSAGNSQYRINNSLVANSVFGDPNALVELPSNLFLLATMNTSDQNVFTLDTAFQRRWVMELIPTSFENCEFRAAKILDTTVSWERFVKGVNSIILDIAQDSFVAEDKRLGPFFITPELLEVNSSNSGYFAESVLKFMWDDAFKFDRSVAFNTAKYQTLEDVITYFNSETTNNRFDVLSDRLSGTFSLGANRLDYDQ